MPRKAPNLEGGVIEHRLTLGDLERTMLKPYADNILSQQKAENIQRWIKTGAMVGGIGVAYMGVRLISNTWASINEILEPVKIWTGKEMHTYTSPDGKTSFTRKNSAAGIPVLGGFVSGMYAVSDEIRDRIGGGWT